MPARFTAYPQDQPALVRVLADGATYRIGRAPECELRIDHASVSRVHAQLLGAALPWELRDAGSKNGVRVNGAPVARTAIEQATWFTVGDVYCALEPLDGAGAAAQIAVERERRELSQRLSARLSTNLVLEALIPRTLEVALTLSGLERGFILYAPPGEPLRVHATHGLQATQLAQAAFSGSVAAVDTALASRRSVVCCDTDSAPWLGARPSVRLGGIRAIVCVPVAVSGQTLGAIYLDSRAPGPQVTELDLELIETVAAHAATALATRRLQDDVAGLLRSAAAAGVQAPRWDELRR